MTENLSVKVSKRYQIAVPHTAREQLNIQSGDRLLVDIQDGVILLVPKPSNFTRHLAGLHKSIWEGCDATNYLDEERSAWADSAS